MKRIRRIVLAAIMLTTVTVTGAAATGTLPASIAHASNCTYTQYSNYMSGTYSYFGQGIASTSANTSNYYTAGVCVEYNWSYFVFQGWNNVYVYNCDTWNCQWIQGGRVTTSAPSVYNNDTYSMNVVAGPFYYSFNPYGNPYYAHYIAFNFNASPAYSFSP